MRDQKYYHITKRKYVESIMERGLIPGHKPGLTVDGYAKHEEVFICTDPKQIIETQAGIEWCKKHDVVVLEVDPYEQEYIKPVKYTGGGTYTESVFEFTTNRVNPDRLHVLSSFEKYIQPQATQTKRRRK